MKSYTRGLITPGKLTVNKSVQGESIEQKLERIVNNKEPIKDGAPLLYTDRKEGVKASTNIRTDRFLIAVEATEKITGSRKARREENAKMLKDKEHKDGEPESIQGKEISTDKPQKNA